MTSGITLPAVVIPKEVGKKTLPYNGNAVTEKSLSFSFACFDRTHDLFNLGDNTADGVISGRWFVDMLECLKGVCNKNISDLKHSMYDLHPIDWSKTNTSAPKGFEQLEYWQFRVNKSRGRIIGFKIDSVFYIVWFDPHHNLTDSEGYGTATKYRAPESEWETKVKEVAQLKERVKFLEGELKAAEELLK
jgi:hypothetical protein